MASTLLPYSSVFAQTRIKLVYPFDQTNTRISLCPVEKRIDDKCCETPYTIETFGGQKGCCRPAPDANASRWNQTTASPCGEFCTSPSLMLSEGAESSCCTSCGGKRSYSSEGRVCGTCCYPYLDCGQAVYSCSIGNGSAACSVPDTCSNPGSWWSSSDYQKYSCVSSSNPCPPVGSWNSADKSWVCACPALETLSSVNDQYACCSSCAGTRYGQTESSVCGSCCPATSLFSNGQCISACEPGTTGYFHLVGRWNCLDRGGIVGAYAKLTLTPGRYQVTLHSGCFNINSSVADGWRNTSVDIKGAPPLPKGNTYGAGTNGHALATCLALTTANKTSTSFTLYQTMNYNMYINGTQSYWSGLPDGRGCLDDAADPYLTYKWTCVK